MDMATFAMAKSYTDSQRLGYAEKETTIILSDSVAPPNKKTKVSWSSNNLIVGQTYIVTVNGVAQNYICKSFDGTPYCGNVALWGPYEDSGEDIFIMRGWVVNGRSEDITISCVHESEIVHTIDPKYLPGAVLPVVELTTVVDITSANLTTLSTEDSNRLNEVVKSKSPIIMNMTIAGMDGAIRSLVLNRMGDNSDGMYDGSMLMMGTMFWIVFQRRSEEEWDYVASQFSLTSA